MDLGELLPSLEAIANKLNNPALDDLLNHVREIYARTIMPITPHQPVQDGAQALNGIHSQLGDLISQLEASLGELGQVYTGPASDTYHASATQSLAAMRQTQDALAFAAWQHQQMGDNFSLAQDMQWLLIGLAAALAVTLGVLVATAGTSAPVTVPAAAGETAGAGASILTLDGAIAAANAALTALMGFLATPAGVGVLLGLDLLALQVAERPKTTDAQTITVTPVQPPNPNTIPPWLQRLIISLLGGGSVVGAGLAAFFLLANSRRERLIEQWSEEYSVPAEDIRRLFKAGFTEDEILAMLKAGFTHEQIVAAVNRISDAEHFGRDRLGLTADEIRDLVNRIAESCNFTGPGKPSQVRDRRLEGNVARVLIASVVAFRVEIGPGGSVGEIDIETSNAIIEVTTDTNDKLQQVEKDATDPTINPHHKRVILYAPNYSRFSDRQFEQKGIKIDRTLPDLINDLRS